MYRWGLVLALGGCAQLAGIDNTSKGVDAMPTTSSLTLEHVAIGKTVVKSPQDLTDLDAAFLVPDPAAPGGQRKVVPTVSGGTWTAETGGVAVPVQFESPELPTTGLRILDFPTTNLKWIVAVFEHPMPEPAPTGGTLTVSVNLDTAHAAETYQLFTIGAWSNIGLAAPIAGAGVLAPGPITIMPANTPTRRVDKLTTNDVVMVTRYSGNQLVAHLDAPPFDQVMNNTITGSMTTTPLNQTLDIRVNQNASAQRLSTIRPAVGAASYVWRLRASPGLDYAIDGGPQLHAVGVPAPTMPDPQTLTAMYGNPFSANFKSLLTWDVRANRTYTGPAGTATLSAGMTERAQPAAALAVTTPAGLPDRITANGTVLNIENAMVPAPIDAPVEISFVTDATANTVYATQVFELVPPAAGAMTYTLTLVVTAHMGQPATKLPRELFKSGSLYVLRAFSFAGCYTGVATGDLSMQALPCAFSFADSGVFQVTP